ncbi:hypothetical protein DLK06_16870 [Acinetobacter pittii]|nr:hypothetical protein DLK06_16870 [Acinetobacter pittii]
MFNYIIYYLLEMDMPKNKEERKSKRQKNIETWAIAFGLIFMFGFWLKYPQFIEYINKERTPIAAPYKPGAQFEMANDPQKTYMQRIGDNYGTYGDSYGSLNTLFSGLAFAALFISLLLQRRELEAQRKELTAQREETKESNKIAENQRKITEQQAHLLAQQIKSVKHQHFNQILFNLLKEKNRRIESMKYKDMDGIEIIKYLALLFIDTIDGISLVGMDDTNRGEYIELIKEETSNYYWSKNEDFGSPFERTLYANYISDLIYYIEDNAEEDYINESIQTLRMFISHDELMCIAWMAIIYPNIEKLVNKYGLLANFRGDEYPYTEVRLQLLFSEKAFEL